MSIWYVKKFNLYGFEIQILNNRYIFKSKITVNFLGPDVTENFLKKNNLEYVIRSHEVKDMGYEVAHNGKCITVFSAPNYCGMYLSIFLKW